MIHFVVTEEGRFGIDDYLASRWPGRMRERIRPVTYAELFARTALPRGVWIFTALDQLTPSGIELADCVWRTLSAAGQPRLLNHPARVLRRYDLLSTLHRAGINRFRAVRAHESWRDLRFPVFLREEDYHTGAVSQLLRNTGELRRELHWARFRGFRLSGLLIVEFCDTSGGAGIFRKYSAVRLGDAVLSRYLHISRAWMVKASGVIADASSAAEECRYVRENPHEPWLRRVFEIAHIDYGRIDYGMLGDAPQVWEINTNPQLTAGRAPRLRTPGEAFFRELQEPGRIHFHERFAGGWEAVDAGSVGPEIPLAVPPELPARWRAETEAREKSRRRRRQRAWLAAHPVLRALRPRLEPPARWLIQRFTSLPPEIRRAAR
jgi:hypothetical protein